MLSDHCLLGTVAQYDEPEWAPLESLVGLFLAGWFMWMHEIRLDDGAAVHAYKHIATRRYMHLAEDGRAFVYCSGGAYCEITPHRAIALAFAGWESLSCEPDDPEEIRAALRCAMDAAP